MLQQPSRKGIAFLNLSGGHRALPASLHSERERCWRTPSALHETPDYAVSQRNRFTRYRDLPEFLDHRTHSVLVELS
jgi:hypothetical protein